MQNADMKQTSRIARALMGLGVTIGISAASLATLDIQLNLPDWLVKVAMIKVAFLGSFGLLALGALIGRHARTRSLPTDAGPAQLGEGSSNPTAASRSRVPVSSDDETA